MTAWMTTTTIELALYSHLIMHMFGMKTQAKFQISILLILIGIMVLCEYNTHFPFDPPVQNPLKTSLHGIVKCIYFYVWFPANKQLITKCKCDQCSPSKPKHIIYIGTHVHDIFVTRSAYISRLKCACYLNSIQKIFDTEYPGYGRSPSF